MFACTSQLWCHERYLNRCIHTYIHRYICACMLAIELGFVTMPRVLYICLRVSGSLKETCLCMYVYSFFMSIISVHSCIVFMTSSC